MLNHQKYIERCIQLAKNGLGTTYPNPMVGCVIVYNETIIGEGWHYKAGESHAEVNAINSVKDKSLLKKATIYVSLEPCNHYGKTPPCSDLIIKNEIPKVIIGTVDPFVAVSGRGIEKLKKAGCEVEVGILKKECEALNKRFFTFHLKKRPYIFLKWAQTANKFIAPIQKHERKPVWITDTYSQQFVHKQRASEMAILVGTETAIEDNPSLTTRNWYGYTALRVVLDLNNRISKQSKLYTDGFPTLILTKDIRGKKDSVIYEQLLLKKPLVDEICEVLHRYHIQSLIIEGGKKTLQTFIDANVWDEAQVFTNETIFFRDGIEAPTIKEEPIYNNNNNTIDTITYYKND